MSINSVDPLENAFYNDKLGAQLALAAKKLHKEVMAQRNEIIQAFIAKYGYEPEDCMQVQKKRNDGGWEWFVCHKDDIP